MTMTRPCRLITRHLSHRTFTEAETFTSSPVLLLQPVGDPTLCQIVWREFNLYPITWKDSDEIRPKLPADIGTNPMAIFEFNDERCVRQWLDHGTFDFDRILLRQQPPVSDCGAAPWRTRGRVGRAPKRTNAEDSRAQPPSQRSPLRGVELRHAQGLVRRSDPSVVMAIESSKWAARLL